MNIGAMRERLLIQRNDGQAFSLVSLTRVSTTATATTQIPHGFLATDYVTIAGSLIAGYNAKVKIVNVPSTTTFTFTCNGALTTPATGTMTVVYTSNAQGGPGVNGSQWRAVADRVPAEHIPLTARESLQLQAIQSDVICRFRIRARADVDQTMRIVWTPSYPRASAVKTLAITGVQPMPANRSYLFLEAAEVSA